MASTTGWWASNRSLSRRGDDDLAHLYDSALDDVYWSRPGHSKMEYNVGTFVEALNFRYVHAYSGNGGSDTATLFDTTADGLTSFAAAFITAILPDNRHYSRLHSAGYGFYTRAVEFEDLRAALGGDDDYVRLYDDPALVDHLVVPFIGDPDHASAKAKFHNDKREIYIDDFYQLWAKTSQNYVDDKKIDPAYAAKVILNGYWADA